MGREDEERLRASVCGMAPKSKKAQGGGEKGRSGGAAGEEKREDPLQAVVGLTPRKKSYTGTAKESRGQS